MEKLQRNSEFSSTPHLATSPVNYGRPITMDVCGNFKNQHWYICMK